MLGVSELKYTVTEKMSSPTHIFDKQWIELLYIWLVLLLALPSFFEALYARKEKQIMMMPFQKCWREIPVRCLTILFVLAADKFI